MHYYCCCYLLFSLSLPTAIRVVNLLWLLLRLILGRRCSSFHALLLLVKVVVILLLLLLLQVDVLILLSLSLSLNYDHTWCSSIRIFIRCCCWSNDDWWRWGWSGYIWPNLHGDPRWFVVEVVVAAAVAAADDDDSNGDDDSFHYNRIYSRSNMIDSCNISSSTVNILVLVVAALLWSISISISIYVSLSLFDIIDMRHEAWFIIEFHNAWMFWGIHVTVIECIDSSGYRRQ